MAGTARTEHIDLKDRRSLRLLHPHVIERRVRGDTALPYMLAFFNDVEGKRAAGAPTHDVLRPELLPSFLNRIVEIFEISGRHTHPREHCGRNRGGQHGSERGS